MQPRTCRCTPKTPVPLLCPDCLDNRRRVRDRINRRKARAARRGKQPRPVGTAVLPSDTVSDLTDALNYLTELLGEIAADGRQLTALEQQLAYSLRSIQNTLSPSLQPAHDESVEMQRPTTQYPSEYQSKTPRFAVSVPGGRGSGPTREEGASSRRAAGPSGR